MSGGVDNNDSAQSPSKSIICSDSQHAGAILLTDDAHSVGICRMLVVIWQFKAYWVCQAEQQQFYSVKQSCRHGGSSAGQVGINVLKGGITVSSGLSGVAEICTNQTTLSRLLGPHAL